MPEPKASAGACGHDRELREFTKEECQDRFLRHILALIDVWAKSENHPDPKEKLHGLAFSILSVLDGEAVDLPGFEVRPAPHPEDKAFRISKSADWWPEGTVDIGGCLHERFCALEKKERVWGEMKAISEAKAADPGIPCGSDTEDALARLAEEQRDRIAELEARVKTAERQSEEWGRLADAARQAGLWAQAVYADFPKAKPDVLHRLSAALAALDAAKE